MEALLSVTIFTKNDTIVEPKKAEVDLWEVLGGDIVTARVIKKVQDEAYVRQSLSFARSCGWCCSSRKRKGDDIADDFGCCEKEEPQDWETRSTRGFRAMREKERSSKESQEPEKRQAEAAEQNWMASSEADREFDLPPPSYASLSRIRRFEEVLVRAKLGSIRRRC